MTVSDPNTQNAQHFRTQITLLLLILLAFARLIWQLDAKNFWWDESLTLQRAEADWGMLLRGTLLIKDGFTEMATTDQHPFLYFVLTGGLIRVAGISEFAVRFVSVAAGTAMVPMVWCIARSLQKSDIAKGSTALWAVLFTAINPFLLWYGQEARPYALWALLALMCTYFLLKLVEHPFPTWKVATTYLITLLLFLSTQYLSVLLLPVHALGLFFWLRKSNPRLAFWAAAGTVGLGALVGGAAGWILLSQAGAGSNFFYVSPAILIPDLLNAFSLGLSVDIAEVWWLDLVYGAVALVGAVWVVRSRAVLRQFGWMVPAFVLIPLAAMLVINVVEPAYMNARHMSVLVGGFVLLLGIGMGALWHFQKVVAALIALVLVGGAGYSTFNYLYDSDYNRKYDDYSALGRFVEKRLLPGDVVLLQQPFSWRIFDYYLPLGSVDRYGVPFNRTDMPTTFERVNELAGNVRRVWLISSGTTPSFDDEGQIEAHLTETMYRVQDRSFYSISLLNAQIYLPTVPVYNEPISPSGAVIDAVFGEQIRLVAYQVDEPILAGGAVPVTLTWQTLAQNDTRYKYILELATVDGRVLGTTEREPYDGAISTNFWQPGQTIVEFSEVPPNEPIPPLDQLEVRLQIYDPNTFEKLPITEADLPTGGRVDADVMLILSANVP